jgi:hypothetical protein
VARRKRTAKHVAEEITFDMVQEMKARCEKFKRGDATAALTEVETKFLLETIKLQQEADVGEAAVGYLQEMTDKQLDEYHERLRKSLENEN